MRFMRVVGGGVVCDHGFVPLSEDEQRILFEIEQKLTESDPALAREVGSTTIYTHAFRNMKWATLTFVVGVVLMIATLSQSFLLAFGGFLVMLASALWFERNARKLGRVGLEQMTRSERSAGFKDYLGSTSQRMRDRFRRKDCAPRPPAADAAACGARRQPSRRAARRVHGVRRRTPVTTVWASRSACSAVAVDTGPSA